MSKEEVLQLRGELGEAKKTIMMQADIIEAQKRTVRTSERLYGMMKSRDRLMKKAGYRNGILTSIVVGALVYSTLKYLEALPF